MSGCVLLLGAGYLAGHVAARIDPATSLILVRRRPLPMRNASAGRVASLALDILGRPPLAPLDAALPAEVSLVFMLPPSAFADVPPAQALAGLFELLPAERIRRAVIVSSSGIYADQDAQLVSADTPVRVNSARVARLHAIEQAWLELGCQCSILRLAGLYGPGRVIGRDAVRAGSMIPGNPSGWLNLLHIEDAAAAAVAALASAALPVPALLSDGAPMQRQEYYRTLARLLFPRVSASTARRPTATTCTSPRHGCP